MARHIIFSPLFTSPVFQGSESGQGPAVKMDAQAMDLKALVDHINSLMGLHLTYEPDAVLLAHYHLAVSRFMAANPQNPLRKTYDAAPLQTSRELFRLRGALAFCGYDFNAQALSTRLDTLNAIEHSQADNRTDNLADRTWAAIRWVEAQPADAFQGYDIATTVPASLHHPTIRRLLQALNSHGATVSTLQQADQSALANPRNIHILHFPHKTAADQYLNLYRDAIPNPWGSPASPTLWIGRRASADNWATRLLAPHSGSATSGSSTLPTLFLPLLLRTHREPLDSQSLTNWLLLPRSPLKTDFRNSLAQSITSSGGYHNKECGNLITSYIDNFDKDDNHVIVPDIGALTGPDAPNDILTLLPALNPSPVATIGMPRQDLELLLSIVSRWTSQKTHAPLYDGIWNQPFLAIKEQVEAMQILLQSFDHQAVIPWSEIDSWLAVIIEPQTFTQYKAEVGCRTFIESPSCMAAMSDLTLWTDLADSATPARDCADLTSAERQALSPHVNFWQPDVQDEFYRQQMLLPLTLSRHVILAYHDSEYGHTVTPHPILALLKGIIGSPSGVSLTDLTSSPATPASDLTPAQPFSNQTDGREIHIHTPQAITWPQKLSQTTLEQIIFHPADFVMEQILGAKPTPNYAQAVRTAKSNVAHAVMAALCQPRGGEASSTPAQIAQRAASEYDALLKKTIQERGALLCADSLATHVESFANSLRSCITRFCNILTLNHLEVTTCEKELSTSLFLLDQMSDDDDVSGIIDMILRDTRDGSSVILDLKWTNTDRKYQSLLLSNSSIQLALYSQMLSNVEHQHVSRVAYFTMPTAHILSHAQFTGHGCQQIVPEVNAGKDVIHQIVNSFHYRKAQIDNGVVELGDGLPLQDLAYVHDVERKNLLPLPFSTEGGQPVKDPSPSSNLWPLLR